MDEGRELGFDRDSVFTDPMFVDPKNNDYRVRPESPTLRVDFQNFDMNDFGVTEDFPERLRD